MHRISGAIQVLQEMLEKEEAPELVENGVKKKDK